MDRFSQTIISRSILLKLRSFFSQFLNGLCIIDRLAIKNNRIFPNSAIKTQYNINRARPIHIFGVYTDQKEVEKYYITLSMRLCEVWNRSKSTLNTAISTVPLKSSFKFDHDVKIVTLPVPRSAHSQTHRWWAATWQNTNSCRLGSN